MQFPLGYWQAVGIRAEPAPEHGVAVDLQVMGGDRGSQGWRPALNEGHGLGGGDVLEHHLQPLVTFQQGLELTLNEHRFSIEHIHLGVGHLAVDQQRHADPLHRLEHRRDAGQITHPGLGVGGGPGWIELGGGEDPLAEAPLQLTRIDRVGEVGRHQWLESVAP